MIQKVTKIPLKRATFSLHHNENREQRFLNYFIHVNSFKYEALDAKKRNLNTITVDVINQKR